MAINESVSGGGLGSGPSREASMGIIQVKLDTLMRYAASGVAIYEAINEGDDFLIVDFNPAAEKIEHVNRADLIGRSVLEVFPGVEDFGLLEVFRRVWRTGESQDHPISVYRDDRITGWRQNYVSKLPNGQIMTVYNDLTQDKRSELVSRMSEQCFRAIADYTYDWEVWIGPTGRVLWTNPAAMRVTGYTVKELISMKDYPEAILHEDDRDRILRAFHSALKGGSGNDVQFRVRRKDGTVVWVEMSWQPIYDESGSDLGHRQSIRDITVRRQAEQGLEQAKREMETILDNVAEVVFHHDKALKVIWANRTACESTQLTREQIIGRYCYDLWGEEGQACKDCPAIQAMKTGCWTEAEKTMAGGRTWAIQDAPIRDENNQVIGGVEIALDITKYKKSEKALVELQRAYDQLEAEIETNQQGYDAEE